MGDPGRSASDTATAGGTEPDGLTALGAAGRQPGSGAARRQPWSGAAGRQPESGAACGGSLDAHKCVTPLSLAG